MSPAVRGRWLAAGAVALLAAVTLLVVAAPPAKDPEPRPVSLPEDLDRYLERSEARFPDLRPGVQKEIVWADPGSRVRTPLALVYLHGFSASRREIHPVCVRAAERLGANLFYTRFTGHGRSDDAMAEATLENWLTDGAEALAIGRRIGERVVVIATSNGAAVAAWLATRPENRDLAGLVLISPGFEPRDRRSRYLLWPGGVEIAGWIFGRYREWEPENEEQARFWTTRYPLSALQTLMRLVRLVERTDLSRIEAPTLVLYSRQDEVVSSEETERRFAEIGSERKELVAIEGSDDASHHVIAGDILSPATTGPVVDRIERFLRGRSG